MCTYFATVIIIGICFGILWGINLAKIDLDKRKDIPSSTVIENCTTTTSTVLLKTILN